MNYRQILLIFRKEVIDILRDKRTLFAMVVIPLLLYPVMFIAFTQIMSIQASKLAAQKAKVALIGAEFAPDFADSLRANDKLEIVSAPEDDYKKKVEEGDYQAAVVIPDSFMIRLAAGKQATLTIYVDKANDKSLAAQEKIDAVLYAYKEVITTQRLNAAGLDSLYAKPIAEQIENVASAKKMGGFVFGRIIPMFLILMMLSGTFYPAVDLTAGEKERGTMATILVSPTNRINIVIGKFLTVFSAAMITALLNIISMGLTFAYGVTLMGSEGSEQLNFSIDPPTLGLIVLLAIPLGFTFSALAMGVSTLARSYKEAQNYLTPVMILGMFPAYASLIPGIELDFPLVIVPVVNMSLLIRDLLLGDLNWTHIGVTVFSTLGLAWLSILFATNLFEREDILFNAGEDFKLSFDLKDWLTPPDEWKPCPTPTQAATVLFVGLMLLFYVGAPLQTWNLDIGLLLTQVVLIFGLTAFISYTSGVDFKKALSFRRPPLGAMILPLFIVPAQILVISELMVYQNQFLPLPKELLEALQQLGGDPETIWGWVWVIFLGAVLPGICEEAMFRGFALSGFRQVMKPMTAVVVVAIAFGIFHLSPYRFMPTALIGVILGYLTIRTGSIFPAMFAHFLNNAIGFVLTKLPGIENISWLVSEDEHIPLPYVISAIIVLGVSLWAVPEGDAKNRGEDVPVQE